MWKEEKLQGSKETSAVCAIMLDGFLLLLLLYFSIDAYGCFIASNLFIKSVVCCDNLLCSPPSLGSRVRGRDYY